MTSTPERVFPEMHPTVPSLLATRRTVRFNKDTRVPGDLVQVLLEAAAQAPSAYNAQPSRFVVNMQCWRGERRRARVYRGGRVEVGY